MELIPKSRFEQDLEFYRRGRDMAAAWGLFLVCFGVVFWGVFFQAGSAAGAAGLMGFNH